MEEYLKNTKYLARSGLSFYNKTWNWNQIQLRKSHSNCGIMMIIEFNPRNLSQVFILLKL
jgi:hypothetical protein